jgi:two-component system nitrate/nitrite response regulator NarL
MTRKIRKMKTAPTMSAVPNPSSSASFSRPATGLSGHIQNSLMKSHLNQTGPAGKSKKQIKVLLVDDHPVVRKGIIACLAQQPNLQVIGEAADGVEALRKAHELKPDIMLMDIDLPEKNGLLVTEAIRKELPMIKVLILSMHTNTDYVLRIVQSGACGYVLKGGATEDLVRAIETVNAGESFFSPEVARTALNQFVRGSSGSGSLSALTAREREVLIHIADGLSNKEIASQLGVGVRTVETHRERIMKKLSIHSVAGLTKFAISQGLVSINV